MRRYPTQDISRRLLLPSFFFPQCKAPSTRYGVRHTRGKPVPILHLKIKLLLPTYRIVSEPHKEGYSVLKPPSSHAPRRSPLVLILSSPFVFPNNPSIMQKYLILACTHPRRTILEHPTSPPESYRHRSSAHAHSKTRRPCPLFRVPRQAKQNTPLFRA